MSGRLWSRRRAELAEHIRLIVRSFWKQRRCSAKLPAGTEMVMPGDNVELEVTLHTPVAMEKGLRFAIREGGRTVGAGTISEIIA